MRKKNELNEIVKCLEDLSNNLNQFTKDLKEILEKINENKESLKLKIQKIFTKLRNALNDREDELLIEVDKQLDNLFLDENLIKEIEKLPNKIKSSLEKGKIIDKNWKEKELDSVINDSINIENNIKIINLINEKNLNLNYNNLNVNFEPDDNGINDYLKQFKSFGNLKVIHHSFFSFKECPINISEGRKYAISGEKKNIVTKTG